MIAGPHFGDYEAGFRFGQLNYELVRQPGYAASALHPGSGQPNFELARQFGQFAARVYTTFGGYILPWTKHVRESHELLRLAFETANKIGDLTYSGYSCHSLISSLLAAGQPLIEVEREAETGLAFAQKLRSGFAAGVLAAQLALIRNLRGQTRKFGCFDGKQFNELQFEQLLSSNPALALPECWYWIWKLEARFLAGDYTAALQASERARQQLWTSKYFIELADYHFYAALARAASFDFAEASQGRQQLEAIAAHRKQLETWAENCPENFENRAALVGAEIARIEGREADAMRLYGQAIRSARANGFVHNEALAHELAGRFYLSLGLETEGFAHLGEARHCYAQWGADGKVRQLGEFYPQLAAPYSHSAAPETAPAVQQLDTSAVVKASQAVSGEIELPKLIETLMTITLENAGADRGLLILAQVAGFEVEVEAEARGTGVEVKLSRPAMAETLYPEAIVNYVIRTQKSVILDDAAHPGATFEDGYLRGGRARSVFCLPMLRQGKLAGVLYLENTQATHAFTPDRIAVLEVLAAQASISLENARTYQALRESEDKYSRIVNTAAEGIWAVGPDERTTFVNARMAEMLGYSSQEITGRPLTGFMFEVDRPEFTTRMERLRKGQSENCEGRFRHKNGQAVWVSASATPILDGGQRFQGCFAMFTDITERRRAEQEMFLLNFAMNNVREAAFLIDENARFRYINDEACRRLQYAKEELLNLGVQDVDLDFPVERWADHWRDLKEQHSIIFESRHKTTDGRIMPVEINANYFEYGEAGYNLALVRDITERKRAEAEFRELQMEMARAHRIALMGQFTASIAHEISQPIAAAGNNASAALRFLKRTPPDLEQVHEALACVVNDTGRAGQIIERIRDQIKKAPPRSESFDINEVIEATLALVWSEVVKNEVTVETQLAAKLPLVRGDRIQLQQVLLNLIYNAVEAMIPVDESERGLLLGTGQTGAGGVLVTVRDSGTGIGAENLEDVFEAFYTTKSNGVGIGLSLCRSIVEAHGGRLWAEANDPRGAQFRFILPAEK